MKDAIKKLMRFEVLLHLLHGKKMYIGEWEITFLRGIGEDLGLDRLMTWYFDKGAQFSFKNTIRDNDAPFIAVDIPRLCISFCTSSEKEVRLEFPESERGPAEIRVSNLQQVCSSLDTEMAGAVRVLVLHDSIKGEGDAKEMVKQGKQFLSEKYSDYIVQAMF